MDTMDPLIALIHKLSVRVLVRSTAQETVWEEVPVWITDANVTQDTQE